MRSLLQWATFRAWFVFKLKPSGKCRFSGLMTHWYVVSDIGEPAAMTNSKDQAQSPRITSPVLMLNGRFDAGNPHKEAQEPMFQLLGTEPARMRFKLNRQQSRGRSDGRAHSGDLELV